MSTEQQQLPSMIVAERERTEFYRSAMNGLRAELERVRAELDQAQAERDALRTAAARALHDLRNGWPEAALDALATALP